MPHSHTHSLPDAFSQAYSRKLDTATALLLWQKCFEFRGEKTFHNIKCLLVCTALLQL